MPFYSGNGDFYRGRVGDPGVFDFLKRAAGTAFNFLAPAPVKAAGTALVFAGRERQRLMALPGRKPLFGGGSRVPMPGGSMIAPPTRLGGGRMTKRERQLVQFAGADPAVVGRVRGFGRRRMNVANIKALRRAIRRMVGFQKVALSVFALLRGVALPTSRGRRAKCSRCGRARCICRALPRGRGDMMMGDFYQGDG